MCEGGGGQGKVIRMTQNTCSRHDNTAINAGLKFSVLGTK